MLGNCCTSVIAGFVIFITLLCLSVPFAILFGALGRPRRLPAPDRRRARRYPDGALRGRALSSPRAIVTLDRLHRVHPDRESRAQPHRHEPHRKDQSTLGLHRYPRRRGTRLLGRWDLRRLRRRAPCGPRGRVAQSFSREIWGLDEVARGFVVQTSSEEDPSQGLANSQRRRMSMSAPMTTCPPSVLEARSLARQSSCASRATPDRVRNALTPAQPAPALRVIPARSTSRSP